ncbi:hypothetical protein HCA68_01020 [Listeria booriae]|uniref:HNH endonuclease n=1 Tax=Listeria booriae TaxID=1552123 RepID=UPI001628354E|nr:HNH endonuclease [Listeria booriae]MBC1896239.1 hypothetical protein [Listeria booriae]
MKVHFNGSNYYYDCRLLVNQGEITAVNLYANKKGKRKIDYQEAEQLVRGGIAGIVQHNRIHIFYQEMDIKKMVRRRDRQKCVYCGAYGDTADHVIPASIGGLTTFTNLVCACRICNFAKGTLSLNDFQKHALQMNFWQRLRHAKKLKRLQFTPYLPINTQQYQVFYSNTKKVNKSITDTATILQQLGKKLSSIDTRLQKMEKQILKVDRTAQNQIRELSSQVSANKTLLTNYIDANQKRSFWRKIFS